MTPPSSGLPTDLSGFRYIKLGRGHVFAPRSLEAGEIHFGQHRVPHEMALSGDKDAIISHLVALGKTPGKAKDLAREVMDFYHLGPETIWLTLFNDRLWWARAEREVVWLGETQDGGKPHGLRFRRTCGPWSDKDELGRPLLMHALSTKLTRVAAFQQTICSLKPEAAEYLREVLAGDDDPYLDIALNAGRKLAHAAENLLTRLHWADFETLVDILLSRGGWHRVSKLGGSLKDADMLVEQALSRETAMVQVKSEASQAILNDYIRRFDKAGRYSRLIFFCHSPDGQLIAPERTDVTIWTKADIAEMVVRHGLMDYLIARQGRRLKSDDGSSIHG